MISRTSAIALSSLALIAAAALVTAGPLTPPAGPVTSTYKTIVEVEPRTAINAANTPGDATSIFKITQPGSYYLTGNVSGVASKNGIAIAASGVTLDLNGYDLVSAPGTGSFDGVSATAGGLTNITVVNGSVRGWGGDGVDMGSQAVANARISGVNASGNSGSGIYAGNNCTVSDCRSNGNAAHGIIVGTTCLISNCTANQNSGSGLGSGANCTITDSTSRASGVYGIATGQGSTVSRCSSGNGSFHGFFLGDGTTIQDCTTFQNAGCGISTNTGCTIIDCTARANTLDGILAISACTIRGNTCSENGSGAGSGAGIHATGTGNRIEGNNCTVADRGIQADFFGNVIVRNTCGGNTSNWSVAAGNVCLVVSGVTGGAISGNSGGAAPGSTDPNANFSY